MAVALSSARKRRNTQRLDQEIGSRLIRYFEGKSLQTITSKYIAAYRDYRLQHGGPSSVIQDLSFLSCMYHMALNGLHHSAASYLIMNGVDIRTVAKIMGHRNISLPMKYTLS